MKNKFKIGFTLAEGATHVTSLPTKAKGFTRLFSPLRKLEVKKAGCQEDRIFNASCHCEGVKRPKQSEILPGLPRSLRSLAMTIIVQ